MAHTIRTRRLKSFSRQNNQIRMKQGMISSYAELQKMIHEALRIQHPEWVGLDGQSEMCEFYEARFAKLLDRFKSGASRPGNGAARVMCSALNDPVNKELLAFNKV
jgi:pyridoxine/pyridoxamine 5'-phosphate oxidase